MLRGLNVYQRTEGLTAARMVEGKKSAMYSCAFLAMYFLMDEDLFLVLGLCYANRYYN